jgi:hypothetical protein
MSRPQPFEASREPLSYNFQDATGFSSSSHFFIHSFIYITKYGQQDSITTALKARHYLGHHVLTLQDRQLFDHDQSPPPTQQQRRQQ